MAKLLKISGRTLGLLIEWSILIVILFAFLIRTSFVQTYLANEAAAYLSKELHAKVEVKSVAIVFIDRLALDGLLIEDQQGDTLIFADRLIATFDDIDLANKKFIVKSVDANNAYVHIQRNTEGISNHAFLRDYFVKNKKKKNTLFYNIKSATLSNSRFKYDDHRKEIRDYGVDYWHINAHAVNGTVNNIQINKDVITGDVTSLSFYENSGFELKSLQTKANVSPRGVKLSSLVLKSKKSTIETDKFDMLSNSYSDFLSFVDSVTFNAQIDKSSLAMDEVALFAYALRGMNDRVSIKTELHKKVKDLKVKNFDLLYGNKTRAKGTLNLSDYRDFTKGIFHEVLDYVYIDFEELEKLKLPNTASSPFLVLNNRVKRLGYVEAEKIGLDGFKSQFVIKAESIASEIGQVEMKNGIMFTENPANNSYLFSESEANQYDVHLEELDLGKLIANKDIGVITGDFHLSGEAFSHKNIEFNKIEGDVGKFEYLKYPYENITVLEGTYKDQVFEGKIDIKDDNLDLVYDGLIDFKGKQKMKFSIDLANAFLDNINIAKKNSKMKSYFTIDMEGRNTDEIEGKVKMDGFIYNANGKEINVPSIVLTIKRSKAYDSFELTSTAGDVLIEGKIDFVNLFNNFTYQFGRIFPALAVNSDQNVNKSTDHFTYKVDIANLDELLAVFVPDLKIAPNSNLSGHYYGEESHFTSKGSSDSVTFKGLKFEDFKVDQILDSNSISALYSSSRFAYNDSLNFDNINFKTTGGKDLLEHSLTWGHQTKMASNIMWNTELRDWDHYSFRLEPSYFHVKDRKWNIAHESNFDLNRDTLSIDHFELTRGNQLITVEGQMSSQRKHHLNYRVTDLEIEEISEFITSEYPMKGQMNGWGFIASPFSNLEYIGDASLINFFVNEREVGDVFVQSEWDDVNKSISARGDLIYNGNQTFDFDGDYYIDKEEDNLDFDLFFDYTDLQFTNAFIDPDVMSDIRGILNGNVFLTGTPQSPELDGKVELEGGSVFIDILGVHFGVDGPVEVDKYGFYMNNIPVFDEEGNAGSLIGSIYHDNFNDFNFDLQFDLERDAINKDPVDPYKVVYLDKFLIMEDEYSPDNVYYGKGYVTGEANIFGYTDNLEITVDVKTKKGTWVNIPMYGIGEIEEENDFIIFKDKDSINIQDILEPKFDFTGVDLDLNFEVTPEADIKIIFNEELGDIISANGKGDIDIKLDNLGNVTMSGIYTVNNGVYDFAMGPVKQKFFIEKGGTINWTGDPYDANLNLKTYYQVNTNIADISQDQFASGTGAHQEVLCYLNLNESLLKPNIEFDITAPQANDVARQLLTRVTSDKDELNRQFFSLLLWKRFQPLSSSVYADGSAAADLITNQINSMLSMVSTDYKMSVAYDSDQLTGDKQYEFGIQKGFLNDRLVLSGSFGVENYQDENEDNRSNLIGDVNLEYLLNESGSFRVNIYNQSTDKTIIYEADLGPFTQGAGFSYKEDFNKVEDFKVIQYFLDVFRKKENKRYLIKRKKEHRPVPSSPNPMSSPPNQEGIEEE